MRFPMTTISLLALASGLCLSATPKLARAQTVWHVDDDASGANDGTSWTDALVELQSALALAQAGDQIWVAQGLYRPDYDVDTDQHTGNRTATFRLMSGVALYGGFQGTETILEERAGLFELTVITGDLNGDDQPEFQNNGENSYHVVTGGGSNRTALLDGFLITAGNANAPFPDNKGAGLVNVSSSPSITNCILYQNSAQTGGGMYNGSVSSPIVTRCLFLENVASGWGGGAINFAYSNALLIECTMRGNRAERGGALVNYFQTNAMMINCVFVDNFAQASGGAVHNTETAPTFINCIFDANHSQGKGGAVYNTGGSNTGLINCTFKGNGGSGAGAIYTTDQFSGTFHSTTEVSSCIAYGNYSNEIASVFGATTIVSFSNVKGGWPGVGNIDSDPLFIDAEGEELNLRLLPDSPCIDAGDSDAIPDCVLDLDGHERFVDDPATEDSGAGGPPVVDMGAYEFGGWPLPDCTGNALPDDCEPDCNENDTADSCDLADGTSEDCNGDGIPDECEPDCNDSGQPDDCDVADGSSEDCNMDNLPDECVEPLPIVEQPEDQQVEVGQLAIFSIVADGVLPEYQWRKDGVELVDSERILGSQTSLLVLLKVVPEDTGEYDCRVSNVFECSNTSEPATLTVLSDCSGDMNGNGDGQVTICHIPPGNPNNARTITVSVNALPAHLAHGDPCGPCAE